MSLERPCSFQMTLADRLSVSGGRRRALARTIHEILLRLRICPYLLRCARSPSSTYCMEYAFVGPPQGGTASVARLATTGISAVSRRIS